MIVIGLHKGLYIPKPWYRCLEQSRRLSWYRGLRGFDRVASDNLIPPAYQPISSRCAHHLHDGFIEISIFRHPLGPSFAAAAGRGIGFFPHLAIFTLSHFVQGSYDSRPPHPSQQSCKKHFNTSPMFFLGSYIPGLRAVLWVQTPRGLKSKHQAEVWVDSVEHLIMQTCIDGTLHCINVSNHRSNSS